MTVKRNYLFIHWTSCSSCSLLKMSWRSWRTSIFSLSAINSRIFFATCEIFCIKQHYSNYRLLLSRLAQNNSNSEYLFTWDTFTCSINHFKYSCSTSSRKRRGNGVLLSRATATLDAMQYLLNQAHLWVSAQQGRVSNSRSQARATSTCRQSKQHFREVSKTCNKNQYAFDRDEQHIG